MEGIKEKIIEKNKTDFSREKRKSLKNLNVHNVTSHLKIPFDAEKMARTCSEKYFNVEGHKYYQMTPEMIKESWDHKTKTSRKAGSDLDAYIGIKLEESDNKAKLWKLDNNINDNKFLKARCEGADKILSNLDKLGIKFEMREIPLYFVYNDEFVFSGREDALFKTNDRYILIDWKSGEISTSNKFQNMLGPLRNFEDCKLVEYTIQTYLYKYFLIHTYGITEPIDVYITELKAKDKDENVGDYHVYAPAFEYDEELIEKILSYCVEKEKLINEK